MYIHQYIHTEIHVWNVPFFSVTEVLTINCIYYCGHQYWATIVPLISTLREVLISKLGKGTI